MKKIISALIVLTMFPLSVQAVQVLEEVRDNDEDNYIVVLKDDVRSVEGTTRDISAMYGFAVEHTYSSVIKGFSGKMSTREQNRLEQDSRVAFVSEDREVHTAAWPNFGLFAAPQTLPTGVNRVDAEVNPNKGSGVTVAVIDTGIDTTHPDLGTSIVAQKSCVFGKTAKDDNGHGTHVAGTIGARNDTQGVVGVAPQVNLAAVKVLNAQGSGTWSQIICGIDWVTANAAKYNIKVVNMSLGGGGVSDNNCGLTNNDAMHYAICRSRDAGVTYVIAAGNSAANAANSVPASYNDAVITVSALTDTDGKSGGLGTSTSYGADDTFASFSNYGSVVDIGAPGVRIYSTWKNKGYNTISGTSMAAPHVAGAAALYIKSNPGSSWTQVLGALISAAEPLGSGHTDPGGLHPEPVLKANSF